MKALEFKNVSFAYADGKPVLNDASFEIAEGEFVALVGENGSGKSTIAKMADAFVLPASGTATVLGRDVAETASKGSDELLGLRCEIGFVQQNPDNQFVATRVIDEVAFGPSGLGISKEDVLGRALKALEQVGAADMANRDVNTLSGGQKQRVTIADALAMRPRLFIFDEPTSMLDDEGKAEIMRIIRDLHEGGAAILLITHSPSEAQCADRVLKIKDGRIEEAPDIALEEGRAFARVMRRADELWETGCTGLSGNDAESGAKGPSSSEGPILEFQNVSFEYNQKDSLIDGLMGIPSQALKVFEDFNMQVLEGEFLCIAGPNGSGKSTLASLMNGLLRPNSGRVLVRGVSTSDKKGANAARRHVGVCFQYPERSLFCQTVLDEAMFAPKNMGHGSQEAEAMAKEALRAVGIDSEEALSASPFDLSGGMQRKVAFASVLSMRPDVLVMDEPCAGLDIEAHAEFVSMLLELKACGRSIVMITHDKRDIEILADRVIFLR